MSQMLRNGKDMRSRSTASALLARTAGSAAAARVAQAEANERADRAALAPLFEQGAAIPDLASINDQALPTPAAVSA